MSIRLSARENQIAMHCNSAKSIARSKTELKSELIRWIEFKYNSVPLGLIDFAGIQVVLFRIVMEDDQSW